MARNMTRNQSEQAYTTYNDARRYWLNLMIRLSSLERTGIQGSEIPASTKRSLQETLKHLDNFMATNLPQLKEQWQVLSKSIEHRLGIIQRDSFKKDTAFETLFSNMWPPEGHKSVLTEKYHALMAATRNDQLCLELDCLQTQKEIQNTINTLIAQHHQQLQAIEQSKPRAIFQTLKTTLDAQLTQLNHYQKAYMSLSTSLFENNDLDTLKGIQREYVNSLQTISATLSATITDFNKTKLTYHREMKDFINKFDKKIQSIRVEYTYKTGKELTLESANAFREALTQPNQTLQTYTAMQDTLLQEIETQVKKEVDQHVLSTKLARISKSFDQSIAPLKQTFAAVTGMPLTSKIEEDFRILLKNNDRTINYDEALNEAINGIKHFVKTSCANHSKTRIKNLASSLHQLPKIPNTGDDVTTVPNPFYATLYDYNQKRVALETELALLRTSPATAVDALNTRINKLTQSISNLKMEAPLIEQTIEKYNAYEAHANLQTIAATESFLTAIESKFLSQLPPEQRAIAEKNLQKYILEWDLTKNTNLRADTRTWLQELSTTYKVVKSAQQTYTSGLETAINQSSTKEELLKTCHALEQTYANALQQSIEPVLNPPADSKDNTNVFRWISQAFKRAYATANDLCNRLVNFVRGIEQNKSVSIDTQHKQFVSTYSENIKQTLNAKKEVNRVREDNDASLKGDDKSKLMR